MSQLHQYYSLQASSVKTTRSYMLFPRCVIVMWVRRLHWKLNLLVDKRSVRLEHRPRSATRSLQPNKPNQPYFSSLAFENRMCTRAAFPTLRVFYFLLILILFYSRCALIGKTNENGMMIFLFLFFLFVERTVGGIARKKRLLFQSQYDYSSI